MVTKATWKKTRNAVFPNGEVEKGKERDKAKERSEVAELERSVRRNSSRTRVLPCEIRVRDKEKELAVCVCLEGVRGSQREVKTSRREICGTSGRRSRVQ